MRVLILPTPLPSLYIIKLLSFIRFDMQKIITLPILIGLFAVVGFFVVFFVLVLTCVSS